jgi:hypothetical protein
LAGNRVGTWERGSVSGSSAQLRKEYSPRRARRTQRGRNWWRLAEERRQELEIGRQGCGLESGNREQETGIGEQGTGSRRRGARQRGIKGSRDQGIKVVKKRISRRYAFCTLDSAFASRPSAFSLAQPSQVPRVSFPTSTNMRFLRFLAWRGTQPVAVGPTLVRESFRAPHPAGFPSREMSERIPAGIGARTDSRTSRRFLVRGGTYTGRDARATGECGATQAATSRSPRHSGPRPVGSPP